MGTDRYRGGNDTGDCVQVSPIIADMRDEGGQVCILMVVGVRNAGETGTFEAREGKREQV